MRCVISRAMNIKRNDLNCVQKLTRSISLPDLHNLDSKEGADDLITLFHGVHTNRKAQSLTYVGDRSNSAAPIRRQPHPFAFQALGFRSPFNSRANRLPEWPPPDPPPLTPLNGGSIGHSIFPTPPMTANNVSPIWPPRPWWRRTGPTRSAGPVVHVTIDTADVVNQVPVRLVERPARIGWTSTSEEIEFEQDPESTVEDEVNVPQQTSWNEVEPRGVSGELNSPAVATILQPIESMDSTLNHIAWIHTYGEIVSENTQIPADGTIGMTANPTEDVGLISLSSEDVQEESNFQIFFVVFDSNRTIHSGLGMDEVGTGLNELVNQHVLERMCINFGMDSEMHSYEASSTEDT
ncbi:uncharacterized protein DEA37_0011660 [Paragonimus westermani]|uniref:Uncharacterized protein n=1 Tax=Paragonimus westermani TaxID=34504 RepID=A0A5J4NDH1_9TREM|nr:uncharacterized protein DEA37_0011660 [Paragonimus westermani]